MVVLWFQSERFMYSVSMKAYWFSVQISSCVKCECFMCKVMNRTFQCEGSCLSVWMFHSSSVQTYHISTHQSIRTNPSFSLYNVLEPKGVVDRDDHRYIRIREPRRKR